MPPWDLQYKLSERKMEALLCVKARDGQRTVYGQSWYGIEGCSEELEFLGDSVLNYTVTREIVGHLMDVHAECTEVSFREIRSGYDE